MINIFFCSLHHSEWLLTKIVNGERASYSAPKFARMQERTRSQMLEDIVANLANHAETGQIPKPYRRGSWRPIGHMRPSSPLLDSVRDQFEGNLLISNFLSQNIHREYFRRLSWQITINLRKTSPEFFSILIHRVSQMLISSMSYFLSDKRNRKHVMLAYERFLVSVQECFRWV